MTVLRSMLALVLVAHLSSVQAAGKGVNRAPTDAMSPSVQALENLRTARALARYGAGSKDALALIVAARMTLDIQAQTIPLTRKGRRDADAPVSSAVTTSESRATVWLALARSLASDRPDLIALADDAGRGQLRGSGKNGPRVHPSRIRGGHTDQFVVPFEGGEPSAVALSGEEDSRLDLYVLDENGERVCAVIGDEEEKICRWTPKWTGRFVIRIVNRSTETDYVLRINR